MLFDKKKKKEKENTTPPDHSCLVTPPLIRVSPIPSERTVQAEITPSGSLLIAMQLSFRSKRCPPALQQQPTAPVNSAYIISPPSVGRCALCGETGPIYQHPLHPPLPHRLPGRAPAASLTKAWPRPYRSCRSQGAGDVDWLNLRLKQTNKQRNRQTERKLIWFPSLRSLPSESPTRLKVNVREATFLRDGLRASS